MTVGQAQEKLPKKVAQNPRVQDALKKALKYWWKKRSITVRYNEEGIPYITPKSGCYLSFQISPIGGEIEILGNEIGLQLLARSILGIAKMEEVDMTYHIHLDELYSLNKEGKSFVLRKIENDDLKWRSMESSKIATFYNDKVMSIG